MCPELSSVTETLTQSTLIKLYMHVSFFPYIVLAHPRPYFVPLNPVSLSVAFYFTPSTSYVHTVKLKNSLKRLFYLPSSSLLLGKIQIKISGGPFNCQSTVYSLQGPTLCKSGN
jgi:hypothetical protein